MRSTFDSNPFGTGIDLRTAQVVPPPAQPKPGQAGAEILPRDVVMRLYNSVNNRNRQSGTMFRQWMSNAATAQALLDVLEAIGTDFVYYKNMIQRYLIDPDQQPSTGMPASPGASHQNVRR